MRWQLTCIALFGAVVATCALPAFLPCSGYSWIPWWKRVIRTRVCHRSRLLPLGCECFDISRRSGFINSFFKLPESPYKTGIEFLLYTRLNKESATKISSINSASILNSHFGTEKRIVFITHGWRDAAPAAWSIAMKDELLKQADINVILTNWKKGARSRAYFPAVANTRVVGAVLGQFIHVLKHTHGVNVKDIHLVGHSLGAHVSGYAGKEFARLNNNQRIGRISGLDPAGPKFNRVYKYVRLDKADADFVDVIHTDAEHLVAGGLGIRKNIGTVDFFPNGGKDQPGCPNEKVGILSIFSPGSDISCDHLKSREYFTRSINNCAYFPAANIYQECKMGYHCSPKCRGTIYLRTYNNC